MDYFDVFISCLFLLSFWRYPSTTADPLVSNWCNAKFRWRNNPHLILDGLRVSQFSSVFHILMNYCFNTENTMHTWCTNAWNQARRIYVHIEYVLGHTHLHVYNYYAIWHYGVSIKHCISNVTQGLPRWNLKLFPLKIPVCLARSKFI